jgi:hypothetical protein
LVAVGQQDSKPQVKVNMLNVCSPSPEEKQEMAAALAKIPKSPAFAPDFEVARGRTTLEQSPDFLQAAPGAQMAPSGNESAKWVRIRREFPAQNMFSTVQYSFSTDPKTMIETLVFRVRDPKDLLQVSVEDSASAVTSAAAMLGTNTPASRIKLERFGKSSVVLARCSASEAGPAPDQSAYEALFQTASSIVADYRNLLRAQQTVPDELARVAGGGRKAVKRDPAPKTVMQPK